MKLLAWNQMLKSKARLIWKAPGLACRQDVHAGTLCALAPEQLKEMLADGDLEERTRQYLEREFAASIAYRENCRRWDEEFSGFIDEDRARLFLALR
jgi:hypothetical protein